jgi:uncharacterized protein YkwD
VKTVPGVAAVVGFLVGFAAAITILTAALPARPSEPDPLIDAVNRKRVEHHLRVLSLRADLSRVAQSHAEDMALRSYLSHINLEGQNPLERAQGAGLEGFRLLAENIGATDVRLDPHLVVVEEWLLSPVHRENLLHPAFNATGLGVTSTADGKTIYVQLYAAY